MKNTECKGQSNKFQKTTLVVVICLSEKFGVVLDPDSELK